MSEAERESDGTRRKEIQPRPPRQLEAETRFKLRTCMVHEAQFLCVYDVLEQQMPMQQKLQEIQKQGSCPEIGGGCS